jgi:hypothetical protein
MLYSEEGVERRQQLSVPVGGGDAAEIRWIRNPSRLATLQ